MSKSSVGIGIGDHEQKSPAHDLKARTTFQAPRSPELIRGHKWKRSKFVPEQNQQTRFPADDKDKKRKVAAETQSPYSFDNQDHLVSLASVIQVDAKKGDDPIYFQFADRDPELQDDYQHLVNMTDLLEEKDSKELYLAAHGKTRIVSSGGDARLKTVRRVEPIPSASSDEIAPFRLKKPKTGEKPSHPYLVRISKVKGKSEAEINEEIERIKEQYQRFHEEKDLPLYFYQSDIKEAKTFKSYKKKPPEPLKKGIEDKEKKPSQPSFLAAKLYIFMPHLGQNLKSFLEEEKKLIKDLSPLQRMQRLLQLNLAILEALQRFHKKDYVHWDFKTENILIRRGQDPNQPFLVTIIDYTQAARLPGSEEKKEDAVFPEWTTPGKSAPEVCEARALSKAIIPHPTHDVFSAGIMMRKIMQLMPQEECTYFQSSSAEGKSYFSNLRAMRLPAVKAGERPSLTQVIECTENFLTVIAQSQKDCSVTNLMTVANFESKESEAEIIERIKNFLESKEIKEEKKGETSVEIASPKLKFALPAPANKKDSGTTMATHLYHLLQRIQELRKEISEIDRAKSLSLYGKLNQGLFCRVFFSDSQKQLKQEKIAGIEALIESILTTMHLNASQNQHSASALFKIDEIINQVHETYPLLSRGMTSQTAIRIDELSEAYDSTIRDQRMARAAGLSYSDSE